MTQPSAYDPATGQKVDIPEEQFADAVTSGVVGLNPKDRVSVVLPDGRKGTVDAGEAASVFQGGGRLYTQREEAEDKKTTAEKAVDTGSALMWGMLRGGTVGLSDYVATKAASRDILNPFAKQDEEKASALRARLSELKEIAPVASGVGEVAGAVLPLFVGAPTPIAGVARAGRAAEAGMSRLLAKAITAGGGKGLVAKAAARAASGAVEGGILGAGQLISEDALGDAEFNAENLLHHVGIGALTGGVASAGAGAAIDAAELGIKKGLEAVKSKFGFKGTREFLESIEEDASLKQVLAQSKKSVRKLDAQGKLEDAGGWLRKNEIVAGGDSLEDIHGKLMSKVEDAGTKVDDFYDSLDDASATLRSASRDDVKRALKEGTERKAARQVEVVKDIDIEIAGLKNQINEMEKINGKAPGGLRDKIRELNAQRKEALSGVRSEHAASRAELMSRMGELDGPISVEDVAARIRKEILPKLEGKPALSNIRDRIAKEADKFDELGSARWSFRDAVEQKNAYGKLSKWNAMAPVEEQEAAAHFRDIYRIINNEIESKGDDLAKKALPAGAFDEFKQAKKDFGMAKSLSDATNDRLMSQQANRVVSPSDYGTGLATTAGMLGHGAGGITSGLSGMVMSAAHKYIRERGNTWVAEGARKLSRLSWLETATGKASQQVDDAVGGMVQALRSGGERARSVAALSSTALLDDASFGKLKKAANHDEPMKARLAELAQLASDPNALADRIAKGTEAFSGAAPRHAGALGAKAAKAVAFLHAKAPKNPGQVSGIGSRPWSPSKSETAKFSRYVAAVQNPMSVIEDIKHGRVASEGVEALREVYPRLYERVTKKLVEEFAADGDKLSYQDRVQLSTLFGVPLDETMRPSFLVAIQQAYAATAPQQGQGGGGMRLSGLDDLNQSQSAMTPTQRVMAGQGK